MYDIKDYQYDLPEGLIAQEPAPRREESRLLLMDRERNALFHHRFLDLPGLLAPGDLLVLNDTRVVPARLYGRKETGGRVEILVLDVAENGRPESAVRRCLVKASKRPRPGARIDFGQGVWGTVEEVESDGVVRMAFSGPVDPDSFMAERGVMPLPPYIHRAPNDPRASLDRDRYQTVYAGSRGAIAAPTAGLHFTGGLLERLNRAGIGHVNLTLHVGHGTFSPVRSRDIREHSVGPEYYRIPPETAEAVNRARSRGQRVIAVGTTVVRTLETAAGHDGRIASGRGRTGLMITPGYRFRVVDGLITNFHLPGSSLLFLVSAFAGLEKTLKAYRMAVTEQYRFYSYGDAMLIL
ncbi:MAG: tRNA preQ1(34) S-adenosylmethionine ribosyltransferase-isomerase QueA [Thermodesulfobacteriota bacterium]